MKVRVTKVYCLNENVRFPECHRCKKELTPFAITTTEMTKWSRKTIDTLISSKLLRLHIIKVNRHLIFLCRTCHKEYIKEIK